MTLRVSAVDVGQGDCTVAVDAASGDGLLIDCPGGFHERAIDELQMLGLRELRIALVTHTHMDHFGGVLDVIEALEDRFTGRLYFNQDSLMVWPVAGEDRKVAGKKLRALVNRASELGEEHIGRAEVPIAVVTPITMQWELLAPTFAEVAEALKGVDPNLASGVVVLRGGDDAFIVGGDAPLATWERLAPHLPKGAVVRWSHHGGRLDADPAAHARVRQILEPSHILVSVGAGNTHGHPTEAFFEAAGGGPYGFLYCTQSTDSCATGDNAGGPCAGTMRAELGDDGGLVVAPARDDHETHVTILGSARCLPIGHDEAP